jgi:hypothetical protein
MWHLKIKLGTLWIRPESNGRFTLGIDDVAIGSYHKAWAAADDVYLKATGYIDWSQLKNEQLPRDLSEWEFTSKRLNSYEHIF